MIPAPAPVRVGAAADLELLRDRDLVCPQTLVLTQERIDAFARASDDFQWIHVDPERAARESPFKSTIAHGFLTLSLLTWFLERTLVFDYATMGLNYGFDRVRFVRPAPAEVALTGRFKLVAVDSHAWGCQLHWDAMVSDAADAATGWNKPILAARWLTRLYG